MNLKKMRANRANFLKRMVLIGWKNCLDSKHMWPRCVGLRVEWPRCVGWRVADGTGSLTDTSENKNVGRHHEEQDKEASPHATKACAKATKSPKRGQREHIRFNTTSG